MTVGSLSASIEYLVAVTGTTASVSPLGKCSRNQKYAAQSELGSQNDQLTKELSSGHRLTLGTISIVPIKHANFPNTSQRRKLAI